MKKQWQAFFYNLIILLCLLECLYPSTFRLIGIRARLDRRHQLDSKMLDAWDFGMIEKDNDNGRKPIKLFGLLDELVFRRHPKIVEPVRNDRQRLQVYIFTEMQQMTAQGTQTIRSLNGSDIAQNRLRTEPSLEDFDLIDCLWRQDIDAEKGLFTSIQPPENQYESDLQMLSEKSFPEQRRMMGMTSGNNMYDTYMKSYDEEFLTEQKKYEGFDPYFWSENQIFGDVAADEKQSWVDVEKDFAQQLNATYVAPSQSTVTSEQRPVVNQTLLAASNVSSIETPINDVMLASAVPSDYNPSLEPLLSIFDEPDTTTLDSMDWNDIAPMTNEEFSSYLDFSNNGNIDFGFETPTTVDPVVVADIDSITTPSLDLTMNDVTRLFSDRQVALDLADAYDHKTNCSAASPITSDSGYSHFSNQQPFDSSDPSLASFYNPDEEIETNDFGVLTEYNAERLRVREKTSVRQLPDMYRPSTSRGSATSQFDGESSDDDRRADSTTPHSTIYHDHHYCSMEESSFVEVEVFTSPSTSNVAYDENKIMPKPIQAIKKQHQEMQNEEYLMPSSKDEELAAQYKLGVSAADIVNMSGDSFQHLLKNSAYSSDQVDLVRKIRRRGRNKVAAQMCRQRRMDGLDQLSTEVHLLEQERDVLIKRQQQLMRNQEEERRRIDGLEKMMKKRYHR